MIRTYARPATLQEALDLLADPNAAVLAGGTDLNGDAAGAPAIAVDLQDLDLADLRKPAQAEIEHQRLYVGHREPPTLDDAIATLQSPSPLLAGHLEGKIRRF